jgi:hypothetical protein
LCWRLHVRGWKLLRIRRGRWRGQLSHRRLLLVAVRRSCSCAGVALQLEAAHEFSERDGIVAIGVDRRECALEGKPRGALLPHMRWQVHALAQACVATQRQQQLAARDRPIVVLVDGAVDGGELAAQQTSAVVFAVVAIGAGGGERLLLLLLLLLLLAAVLRIAAVVQCGGPRLVKRGTAVGCLPAGAARRDGNWCWC